MSLSPSPELSDLHAALNGWTLPRWRQLPEVDLYMDQVLLLMEKYLRSATGERVVTSAMINNYVKAKLVAAPVNKKYPRGSVAMVIVICLLKNCYSTEEIGKLIQLGLDADEPQIMYDRFCDSLENALRDVFSGEIHRKDESLPGREKKYLMENFALTFACKLYVQHEFLKTGK